MHWNKTIPSFCGKLTNSCFKTFICLFLVISILIVYWQVTDFEFVNLDDTTFVTENSYVQKGLTWDGIKFVFTNPSYFGMQLSFLSHMLDCEIFELNAGGHHLTSLFFHVAATLLLFFVLNQMTGAVWKSAFAAAIFALHPVNVESVAWVAERRNVLSTFFWFLTVTAYFYYTRRPGILRYLAIIFCFILGLLSKSMLITLPFVLLLLDYWPLNRFKFPIDGRSDTFLTPAVNLKSRSIRYLVIEKLPLIAISFFASYLAFIAAQNEGGVEGIGGIATLEMVPLQFRVANALIAYVSYIGKMVWPTKLAVMYPYPVMFPWWKIAGALMILLCITVLAIKWSKKYPFFIVGWVWFLGTLVPVIGIVQLSFQAMADRYAYVPLVGLFIIVAWGIPEIVRRWRHKTIFLFSSAIACLLILMVIAWKQTGYWKNNFTLYEHTLAVTSGNFLSHNNLGIALFRAGKTKDAIQHYWQAIRFKPDFDKPYYNLGNAMMMEGKKKEAIGYFKQAVNLNPGFGFAHYNLGIALIEQGRTDEAIHHLQQAVNINPEFENAHCNLGIALNARSRTTEAIYHLKKAIQLRPDYVKANYYFGVVLDHQGKTEEAIRQYLIVLGQVPDHAEAHNGLGIALNKQGKKEEALRHFQAAIRINPDFDIAYNNIGIVYIQQGNIEEAVASFEKALQINPDYSSAKDNLQKVLAVQQKNEE